MTTITQHTSLCTLINVFTVSPERQQELVDVLTEVTDQVIRHMPGFVSANIHKSIDGLRVTNYAQWESQTYLHAMLHYPAAIEHIDTCRAIALATDMHLYTVEHCNSTEEKLPLVLTTKPGL